MSKQLSIDDMLEAARDSNLPLRDQFTDMAVSFADLLGEALARHLNIDVGCASADEKAFGGVLVPFWPKDFGDPCPDVIHEGDKSGDWE